MSDQRDLNVTPVNRGQCILIRNEWLDQPTTKACIMEYVWYNNLLWYEIWLSLNEFKYDKDHKETLKWCCGG